MVVSNLNGGDEVWDKRAFAGAIMGLQGDKGLLGGVSVRWY